MLTTKLSRSMLVAFAALAVPACGGPPREGDALRSPSESDDDVAEAKDCGEMFSPVSVAGGGCPGQSSRGEKEIVVGGLGADEVRIVGKLVDGQVVVDGDIVVTDDLDLPVEEPEENVPSAAGVTRSRLWPAGRIPYVIDPNLPNKQRITDAVAHWNANTGIRLFQRTNESAYVTFTTGNGCYSALGRTGGAQTINLASNCPTGTVIHEIGHTVGLWHEQARPDRNNHVTVLTQNIQNGLQSQFAIQQSANISISAYDIGSIMHYSSYAFSANGKPTIVTKTGGTIPWNRTALTATDKAGVARLYDGIISGGTTPTPTPTPGDTTAPVVQVINPANGTTYAPNTTIKIVADATDAGGIASVALLWKRPAVNTLACPGSGVDWSCTQSGNRFTWTLNVGSGTRTFQVRATDKANNATASADRTLYFR